MDLDIESVIKKEDLQGGSYALEHSIFRFLWLLFGEFQNCITTILASFLIIYFINTNYTNSVKSIYFLLLYVTKFVHECQIELGFSKIRGSAKLNIDFS